MKIRLNVEVVELKDVPPDQSEGAVGGPGGVAPIGLQGRSPFRKKHFAGPGWPAQVVTWGKAPIGSSGKAHGWFIWETPLHLHRKPFSQVFMNV